MSMGEIEERPQKRRRFFSDTEAEDASAEHAKTVPLADAVPAQARVVENRVAISAPEATINKSFDVDMFKAVVGDIEDSVVKVLKDVSGGNTERAINMYLDGSWQVPKISIASHLQPVSHQKHSKSSQAEDRAEIQAKKIEAQAKRYSRMPERRYIGAFGVGAWATRSGSGLVRHGETCGIERQKRQQTKLGKGGKPVPFSRQKADVIVRFTNSKGEEVGRLPNEIAKWVSALIDQGVCQFDGVCVFAPDRVRVNETIFLQLRAYLLRTAFEGGLIKPLDNNRKTGIFEEKETTEEQDLRLRQVGLVKLFDEVNLHPRSSNPLTEKHKKQGLLHAADVAEQYEADQSKKATGDSPKDSDEEKEEGEELEQDQLDTLYQKAQSFDFDTPIAEPAGTFVMNLRKYQKQALHWMMSKEKDEKSENKDESMHPLWEEYRWPGKDVDDKALPIVEDQDSFYVNPYSGEMSLDFPRQEQHCLGGILADEMGLGKTIEMLSLIHSHRSASASCDVKEGIATVNNLPRLPKSSSGVVSAPATTLVVAPMSLLAQWESEAAKASAGGTLKTLVYYGSEKAVNLQNLCCEANAAAAPNLVITSYGTVLSEFNQVASRGGDRSAIAGIFSLDFFRIILDEAHYIKNRQSKTAKACYELTAQHRWVLTGTPIVNRLEDLFSLVRFLRVEPWSNFSFWKTFITVPFESKDFIRALDVVQTVLEPLVIRRTKDMRTPDGQALVPLPPRSIDVEEITLSKAEQEVYDYIYQRAKRTFNATMEAGTLMKSYATIFAQLIRLRQSCCHPILTRNKTIAAEEEEAEAAADMANGLADDMDLQTLIARFEAEQSVDEGDSTEGIPGGVGGSKFPAHALKQIQDDIAAECPICSEEPMIEPTVTSCWHSACKQCLIDYIEHQTDRHQVPRCFNCRETINGRDIFEIIRHDDDIGGDDDNGDKDYKDSDGNEAYENQRDQHIKHDNGNLPNLYDSSPPRAENTLSAVGSKEKVSNHQQSRISLRRVGADGSAKIAALVSHLKRQRRENRRAKSVVFSQFTSFLDLIGPALEREGIPFLRFDGAMSQRQRAAVLQEYAEAGEDDKESGPATRSTRKLGGERRRRDGMVLLLSLRAGGVGLNLVMASRVYMMDPWWSFAVEAQAIDRVHRMGQQSEVKVIRFIVAGSIEQRMLKVQERKKFIASSLGMMSEEEKKMQRIEDIKELLS